MTGNNEKKATIRFHRHIVLTRIIKVCKKKRSGTKRKFEMQVH